MLYYTHHSNCTLTTTYAFMVYHVSLHNKSYYTYLSNTDAHHYISTDVLYDSSTD